MTTHPFREPPKPPGADSDQKCATKGCGRHAMNNNDWCADCWDMRNQIMPWHQRQGTWSGK